jgi:hypothetical protein
MVMRMGMNQVAVAMYIEGSMSFSRIRFINADKQNNNAPNNTMAAPEAALKM